MIEYDLDDEHSILLVKPQSPLEQDDFVKLTQAVDPFIEATGGPSGLNIDAPKFPGWDSFGAMVTHFRFVRDHQRHIKKIGIVPDSHLGDLAEHLASHFVAAEIKHFPAGQSEAARRWVSSQEVSQPALPKGDCSYTRASPRAPSSAWRCKQLSMQ